MQIPPPQFSGLGLKNPFSREPKPKVYLPYYQPGLERIKELEAESLRLERKITPKKLYNWSMRPVGWVLKGLAHSDHYYPYLNFVERGLSKSVVAFLKEINYPNLRELKRDNSSKHSFLHYPPGE
jgi:hypothetical protein